MTQLYYDRIGKPIGLAEMARLFEDRRWETRHVGETSRTAG
jgi:hypothetical protein